ncbi:HET domain-containing protein [Microdochium nivale]|nr:HET domain-containing protein [Microdochium nivale]
MAMLLPYSRLDHLRSQIRLLKLEPTFASPPQDPLQTAFFDDTPVRCSIEVVSLDDNPKFVALSYAWGNLNETAPITINGVEVHVTRNLRRALALHSSRQHEYPIWADAVCINQANLGEKSSQIKLMSRVYEQAASVFCWLGLATPHIREYLAWRTWLDRRGPKRSQNREQLSLWWHWTYFQLKSWRPLRGTREEYLYSVASVLKGQADFIGLPYFERMWTLQESTLPSSERVVFAVGPYLIPGFDPPTFTGIFPPASVVSEIASLKRQLRHPCSPAPAGFTEVFNDAALLHGADTVYRARLHATLIADLTSTGERNDCDRRGHELGRLLFAMGDRKCHDPRDKIFALLSLVESSPAVAHKDEASRERACRVQGSRDRWLAIDYTKQAEIVMRDALYYVYGAENGSMFYRILKMYQPRREALLMRQRSEAQRKEDCRNGLQPRMATEGGVNVYRCRGDYVCPTWLPDMTQPNHPQSI